MMLSAVDVLRVVERFNPQELRAPKGSDIGGRWIRAGGFKKLAGDLLREHDDDVSPDVAEVFDGTYGNLRVRTTRAFVDEDGVDITAEILDHDGTKVGKVRRIINRDKAGDLYAEHSILALQPHVQGQGFAKAFNAHLEDWYRESGVERIELHADIDVGGYTWTRQGYDFRDGVPKEIRDRLAREANPTGGYRILHASEVSPNQLHAQGLDESYDGYLLIGPDFRARGAFDFYDEAEAAAARDAPGGDPAALALLARIDAGEPVSAFEISQLGRQSGAGRDDDWIGKRVMLGSEWYGVKWLDPDANRAKARPQRREYQGRRRRE